MVSQLETGHELQYYLSDLRAPVVKLACHYVAQVPCYITTHVYVLIECMINFTLTILPVGYSVIVGLPIGYSVIVALTGLPIGYSVIVALTGLPIGYSVIVALTGPPIGYSVIVALTGLPIGYSVTVVS